MHFINRGISEQVCEMLMILITLDRGQFELWEEA